MVLRWAAAVSGLLMMLADQVERECFIGRIPVTVEEADRNTLHAFVHEIFIGFRELHLNDFAKNQAVGTGPFINLASSLAGDERFRLSISKVKDVPWVRPLQSQNVAKTPGGDQSDLRAFSLQNRVDDKRLTVKQLTDLVGVNFAEFENLPDALPEIVRRHLCLRPGGRAAVIIERHKVYEAAPDVDRNSQRHLNSSSWKRGLERNLKKLLILISIRRQGYIIVFTPACATQGQFDGTPRLRTAATGKTTEFCSIGTQGSHAHTEMLEECYDQKSSLFRSVHGPGPDLAPHLSGKGLGG